MEYQKITNLLGNTSDKVPSEFLFQNIMYQKLK